MKILLVTETLSIGGAETFVLRLASALASRGHDVTLLNLLPQFSSPELLTQLSANVHYSEPLKTRAAQWFKLDSLALRSRLFEPPLTGTAAGAIAYLLTADRPDVVHTHLFKPDYYAALARQQTGWKGNHVTTNHGDYLLYHRNPPRRILRYSAKLNVALRSVNHFVNISDEQQHFTENWARKLSAVHLPRFHKILNGYALPNVQPASRAALGFAPDDFVFVMVARGIAPKGWNFLADAFDRLERPGARLLLVGDGPAISELRARYAGDTRVYFAGTTPAPTAYISIADAGVLPSVYDAESLPTVVIEYLACGKPVLATDVGEIRSMLQGDAAHPTAGGLLSVKNKQVDVNELAAAMRLLMDDRTHYSELAAGTKPAFARFSMDACVEAYEKLYADV